MTDAIVTGYIKESADIETITGIWYKLLACYLLWLFLKKYKDIPAFFVRRRTCENRFSYRQEMAKMPEKRQKR